MCANYPQGGEAGLLKELYKDASNYEKKLGDTDPRNIAANDPVGIVDPRYVGFDFLSYVFMETGEALSTAMKTEGDQFQGENQNKGMMASLCFGQYDVVHRRAELNKYSHARFAVDSKDRLDFCKSIETYPIFTVGRWHGQDVETQKTLRDGTADLTQMEAALICEKIQSPNASSGTLKSRMKENWDIENEYTNDQIETKMEELERRGVWLGTSIPVKPAEIPNFQHVLVGMTVEERETEDEDRKMPNEAIIEDIMDEYDGWEMPYICSGVGQNWADIIAEMHLDDISDMNDIADNLRQHIDGVRSTETFLLSSNLLNEPLKVSSPKNIIENQKT